MLTCNCYGVGMLVRRRTSKQMKSSGSQRVLVGAAVEVCAH
jgi:hypothetical protein